MAYNSPPRRFALIVMIKGPSHIPKNIIVNAYSIEPPVPNAPIEAVMREMMSGPHRSQCLVMF